MSSVGSIFPVRVVGLDASYKEGGGVPGGQQSSSPSGEGKAANWVNGEVLETACLGSDPTTITWAISEALCPLGAFLRKERDLSDRAVVRSK